MGDHLVISGGLLQAPLNPLKTDVSRGLPGLSGGTGPLGPHRNSTTANTSTLLDFSQTVTSFTIGLTLKERGEQKEPFCSTVRLFI